MAAGQRWYGMFRYNYSFQDDKLVEGLAGLNTMAAAGGTNGVPASGHQGRPVDRRIFLQLELNGMGRIGSNPLDV